MVDRVRDGVVLPKFLLVKIVDVFHVLYEHFIDVDHCRIVVFGFTVDVVPLQIFVVHLALAIRPNLAKNSPSITPIKDWSGKTSVCPR